MHRDPRKPPEYFVKHSRRRSDAPIIEGVVVDADGKILDSGLHLHRIFRTELELLIAAYSAGASADELRARYPRVIEALGAHQRVSGPRSHEFQRFDAYIQGLWLVALAILLDIDDAGLKAAIIQIKNGAQDALFDRLLALRMPDRAKTTKLLYPKPYKPLYEALDAPVEAKPALVAKFLKNYYNGMAPAYWQGSHDDGDVEDDDRGYFGYWCFELAAFAKCGVLDDTSFRDHEMYPRDLV